MLRMVTEIEQVRKRTYDVKLRSVRIFAFWALLKCLYHLIHWDYISCYYSQTRAFT